MSHTACRLLIDPPASGAWNMAVDEMLFEWSAATERCCWRLYRWHQPTLSLGYFQTYDDRRQHAPSLHCPVVRRISGGGAILHDHEITYSVALPIGHRLARERLLLYQSVHTALIAVLARRGIRASLCRGQVAPRSEPQPFLCFQRRAPGDVLVGDVKIVGSAQRRSSGAVLQHGSVLLGRSSAAPELEGLDALANSPIRQQDLIAAWLEELSEQLALGWREQPLSEPERRRIAELVETKYASGSWTKNRGRQPRSS